MSPQLYRDGGLIQCIQELGWTVNDHGDLKKDQFTDEILVEKQKEKLYKYDSVSHCTSLGVINGKLSDVVHKSSAKGDFVVTLGGDHGIATGSISGMLRTYPDLKVIWIDAHGDFNTPETTVSGYLGGMPLACLAGRGLPELREAVALAPAVPEAQMVLIGARDLDAAEADLLADAEVALVRSDGLRGGPRALAKAIGALGELPVEVVQRRTRPELALEAVGPAHEAHQAERLVDDHVPAGRPEGDADGLRELLRPAEELLAGVVGIEQLLRHVLDSG